MTRLMLALFLALATLAAPDAARGDAPPGPVAEIATFRLAAGITDAAFLETAAATGPVLAAEPAFLSRRLSRGTDGNWTDHVAWRSLAEAEAAALSIVTVPAARPFLMAIDPGSILMRHERLLVIME